MGMRHCMEFVHGKQKYLAMIKKTLIWHAYPICNPYHGLPLTPILAPTRESGPNPNHPSPRFTHTDIKRTPTILSPTLTIRRPQPPKKEKALVGPTLVHQAW